MERNDKFARLICKRCGQFYYKDLSSVSKFDTTFPLCPSCVLLYPPAILKAMGDPFCYAVGLRNGMILFFECVEDIHGDWITLRIDSVGGWAENPKELPPCPRGIEIRLSDIVWAADAPFGS